ncbi:GlyGly-CTERM sorting domain-containing protein [Acidovorax sp. BoFeN1]|nr:GlyGly-CTERM sorting domain-containing protein [Acidovorax sp. BoFeN1]
MGRTVAARAGNHPAPAPLAFAWGWWVVALPACGWRRRHPARCGPPSHAPLQQPEHPRCAVL